MLIDKPLLGELPVVYPDGLVADYVMNEGGGSIIQDSSGNGNTGTFIAETAWVSGRNGPAISFDGVNDAVSTTTFSLGGLVSVSVWLKFNTLSADTADITYKRTDTTTIDFWMVNNEEFEEFRFYTGGTADNNAAFSATIPVVDRWYHVVGVYDGVNTKIYVDGQFEADAVTPLAPNDGDTSMFIGEGFNGSRFLSGEIENLKVYSIALTSGEIQQLYNDSFWYFRKDPIEFWTAVAAASAGITPAMYYQLMAG